MAGRTPAVKLGMGKEGPSPPPITKWGSEQDSTSDGTWGTSWVAGQSQGREATAVPRGRGRGTSEGCLPRAAAWGLRMDKEGGKPASSPREGRWIVFFHRMSKPGPV